MSRYFSYSLLLHVALLLGILFAQLTPPPSKVYHIDFFGGAQGPRSAAESLPAQSVQPQQATVNPKEDLLIRSKQKTKRQKTLAIPSAAAIPSSRSGPVSAIPSAVPGVANDADNVSGVGVGVGEGGGVGNFPYTWYVHSVRKKLDANWNVSSGFDRKIFAQVAFTIEKDGSLSHIEIEESSNNEVFDRAARRAVEYSQPLPPLPRDFQEPNLRVHVRFTVKR